MKKSKNETAAVVVCFAVATLILGIMGIAAYCEWPVEAVMPAMFLIFLVYLVVHVYREEKPIYDRAKRIKALREQAQQ